MCKQLWDTTTQRCLLVRNPPDEMFVDGLDLQKWVATAFLNRVVDNWMLIKWKTRTAWFQLRALACYVHLEY